VVPAPTTTCSATSHSSGAAEVAGTYGSTYGSSYDNPGSESGDHYGDLYDDLYGVGSASGGDRIFVEIDWSRSGFTDYLDDVTADVIRPPGVSVAYGRDQTTALAPTVSGQGSFTLHNRLVNSRNPALGRKYSPRNPDSPLAGTLKPARPVRISRQVAGIDYSLFHGHTDDTPLSPNRNEQTVTLSLVDYLADLRGQSITTQLHRGIRTGEAIALILDAVDWPEDARDLDAGATVIEWWWESNTDAFTALEKLLRSEGPPAMLFVGSDSEIVFRDRHHRLIRTASITSQGTWRDKGLEPIIHRDNFTYDESWGNIINAGNVSVDIRAPAEVQPVWTSETPITLSAGEQKILTVTATDPFLNAETPVGSTDPEAGADFTILSGSVAVRLITDSGLSTGIELTAGAGGATLSGLQLRAQPVTVAYTVQVQAEDSESIAEYGRRNFADDLPWCGVGDAEAVLSTAVALRSQPLPIITARFLVGTNATKAAQILSRDLSDLVTVIEPETYTDGDFYIESIAHELTSEHDHAVTFGLEAAPVVAENVALTDVAGRGADQGTTDTGINDPATIILTDSTDVGHRLDEGRTAA
jgi:hypothetical protein